MREACGLVAWLGGVGFSQGRVQDQVEATWISAAGFLSGKDKRNKGMRV